MTNDNYLDHNAHDCQNKKYQLFQYEIIVFSSDIANIMLDIKT